MSKTPKPSTPETALLATWVNQRLVVVDPDGSLLPPGAGESIRLLEPDGGEVTAITRGDAVDLYFGRKTIYNYSVSPRTAARLAWWLLRWWVWSGWCGLKLKLWHWSLSQILRLRWKRDI